jgi:CRP-like cAMP-binding protein
MNFDLRHVAGNIPLFAGVDLNALEAAEEHAIARTYNDREVILRKGDRADSIVVLVEGQVAVADEGTLVVHCKAPEVVGERGFFGDAHRSATVTADGAVRVLILKTAAVEQLIKDGRFVRNLLHVLSGRLSQETAKRISLESTEYHHQRGNQHCVARACAGKKQLNHCPACDGGVLHRTIAFNHGGVLHYELLCDNPACNQKATEPADV